MSTDPWGANEFEHFQQLVRSLPSNARVAMGCDVEEVSPTDPVDLVVIRRANPTRGEAETAISQWEPRVKKPNGMMLFHGYDDPRNPNTGYTDALNEWLRRRAEFWQVIRIVGHQLLVRARPRR